ncbi:MAG TPA: biotin--[acetyl-CoA-carboxylase] ligase [Candidatus Treponema faecavium]|nr:biotin--[acetyl-CoA-carboxylase] ligase [Candidatus Treponema faecavium]
MTADAITGTAAAVLSALKACAPRHMSGEEMAGRLGVSRAAVWKAIDALRARGYVIAASSGLGYRLDAEPDILNADAIASYLREYSGADDIVPDAQRIHVFGEIDSTNTAAKTAAAAGGALRGADGRLTAAGERLHKNVFCAETQTAGKGRQGRSFYSPAGRGLYMSLLYAPAGGVKKPAVITAGAAVAVCRAASALYGRECLIKWVNDVFYNGKKVCGILTEGMINMETMLIESAVIGIGVNILDPIGGFPADTAGRAGSLLGSAAETALNRSRFAAAVIGELLRILEAPGALEAAFGEYRRRSLLTGRTVTIYPLAGEFAQADRASFEALVLGVTDGAELIVERADGVRMTLDSGEASLHGSL